MTSRAHSLPDELIEQVASVAKVPSQRRARFGRLLSSSIREAWRGDAVKRKPLRASDVKKQFAILRGDAAADLEGDAGEAALTFLAAVQAANPRMGLSEAIDRAEYHATKHPGTCLPNRGRSRGTTGNPAFNTFCTMFLAYVTLVDGKLVCWRVGRRVRQPKKIGSTRLTSGRWTRHKAPDVRPGTAKGSFVLALQLLKSHLPPVFVPVSSRAVAAAFERAKANQPQMAT